jgi:hypothetical protein
MDWPRQVIGKYSHGHQPSSDGFPEGFVDQRFERWVSDIRNL